MSPRTKVSAEPNHWESLRLGDIAAVTAGGTPNRTNPLYWDGEIPWVTTSEVDFGTIAETEQSITKLGLKSSAAKLMPPGTLLLALYGQGKTRGKVAILGIAAATNQACAAISVQLGVSVEFVYYSLLNQYQAIRRLSNIGNQENLNLSLVRSIPVALAPAGQQAAIAEALSDVDALLNSLDALIAKKRAIKQAAMQQLLTGRTRLPGYTAPWGTRRIGDFAECTAGGTPSTSVPAYWGGPIRWMSSGELNHKLVYEVEGRITQLGLRESSTKLIPIRCVLVGLAGQGRTRGTVAMNFVELCTNQSIGAVLPKITSVNVV